MLFLCNLQAALHEAVNSRIEKKGFEIKEYATILPVSTTSISQRKKITYCDMRAHSQNFEVTAALEKCHGGQHLEEAFHVQLKRTQHVGGFLQQFATVIDHLAHHAHIDLLKQNISREAVHAFADGVRDREIKCQLLLACKKTFSESFPS
jgi:hypothetical protein